MLAPNFAPDSRLVDALRPSPNAGERKDGKRPTMILLHYTGMPAGRGMSAGERAIRWLENPASQVSAHYVIDEDGTITQMVSEDMRAWHAGVSSWGGETDINSVSIGIEIANPGHPWDLAAIPDRDPAIPVEVHPGYCAFPEIQIARVVALVADIASRHRVNREFILAHSDVAPGRKQDPGEKFPWFQLAAVRLGLWVPPEAITDDTGLKLGDAGEDVEELQEMLTRLGFAQNCSGVFDLPTRDVITALQRHWRPTRVDGIVDQSTRITLKRLLAEKERMKTV